MPMLPCIVCFMPDKSKPSWNMLMQRSASSSYNEFSVPLAITINSSPAKRYGVKLTSETPDSRAAIWHNASSPTECPYVSLIYLKLSTSIIINANGNFDFSSSAISFLKHVRLLIPVRISW